MAQRPLASQIADFRARIDSDQGVGGTPTEPDPPTPPRQQPPAPPGTSAPKQPLLRRLAWLPIPLLLLAMAGFWAADLRTSHESLRVAIALNFVFSVLVSVFIACLIARSFLARGNPGLLLLGCGIVVWGFAGIVGSAAGLIGAPPVAIHNSCVWLSAICNLAGAALLLRPRNAVPAAGIWLAAAYTLAVGAVALIAVLTLDGWMPPFFIEGHGGTPLRQVILGSAIAMFALTAALLRLPRRQASQSFPYWYSLALALVVTGLLGVMVQSSRGSWLGWTGRAAQLLSGVYMLIAAIASVRESGAWHISLEAALRESEERYRQLFTSLNEGFYLSQILYDDAGRPCDYRYLDVNAAFENLMGLSREQIVGKRYRELVGPDPASGWLETFRKVALTGVPAHYSFYSNFFRRHFETFAFRPSGEQFAVLVTDITERKQAEDALRQSEEQLRALAEAMPNLASWANGDGYITWYNRRWYEYTGTTPQEMEGWGWQSVHDPQMLPAVLERWKASIATGEPFEMTFPLRGADGQFRRFLTRIQPLKDAQGRVVRWFGTNTDVEELKRAEEAMLHRAEDAQRMGEEEFHSLAEAMPQIVWATRADGWNIYFNQQWVDYTGMTMEESHGHGWNTPFHPDDKQRAWEAWQRATQHNEPYSLEVRLRRADGVYRWWLVRGAPMLGASGEILKWFGTCTDIEELKRGEAALREANDLLEQRVAERTAALRQSEEQFRTLAEAITNLAWWANADGYITWYNRRWYEYTGTTPEQMEGWGWQSVHDPQALPAVMERWQASIATGEPFDMTFPLRGADGQYRRFLTRIQPVKDAQGRVVRWFGTNTDVEELTRAEEAAAAAHRQVQGIIDNTTSIVYALDLEERFVLANAALAEILSSTPERIFGKTRHEFMSSEDADWHEANDRQVIEAGRPLEFEEYSQLKGRSITWLTTKFPLRDAQGRIYAVAGISADVSDRKKAEQELKAAKLSAEQAQAAAEQAKAAAEAASKAKDQFIAVLSHELRNPLNPVLATVAMLQKDSRFDADTCEQLEVIHRNVELEARLIDDLLDVTRIERGKIELDRRPIELRTIIHRAAEVCLPDIEARNLEFGTDLGPAPYWVEADAARLQQVFWNLIKNAIKFTPEGGCVGVRCRRVDGHAVVEVNDSGEGIDPEVLPRLFSAFEQGGRPITRQFGGLGLGLTISKAMVEMHGGSIEAHSAGKGKGATFTVRLPLLHLVAGAAMAATGPASAAPAAKRAPPEGRPLRILLVEDHGDTARIMRRLLSAAGHDVQNAADVATALKLADEQPFDLLLSDLGLPDGSGLDLLRAIRAKGRNLPAIALSGFGQEQDVQQSREAGFAIHLIKPVSLSKLEEAIATVVGGMHRKHG